jgi:hypothetical protein
MKAATAAIFLAGIKIVQKSKHCIAILQCTGAMKTRPSNILVGDQFSLVFQKKKILFALKLCYGYVTYVYPVVLPGHLHAEVATTDGQTHLFVRESAGIFLICTILTPAK